MAARDSGQSRSGRRLRCGARCVRLGLGPGAISGTELQALSDDELKARLPQPSEVAQHVGLDVESVIEALAADGAFTPASLDVPVGEDGAATLGDLMPDEDLEFGSAEARVMLGPAVRKLAPRDRRILELRFFEGWTQEQIAKDIGVTQMQVSRLLSRILKDLREALAEQ